jgi:hypothetical protein
MVGFRRLPRSDSGLWGIPRSVLVVRADPNTQGPRHRDLRRPRPASQRLLRANTTTQVQSHQVHLGEVKHT